jgi:hypothetical protein
MELITVKTCNILVLYGHNYMGGENRFRVPGFQNIWNIVKANDSDQTGCAYAAVITCNADKVPNEIPLPGYSPFSGLLPVKDASEDNDMVREMQKAKTAAQAAVADCCKKCKCKEIKITYKPVGLSWKERLVFPTYDNEVIKCKKDSPAM